MRNERRRNFTIVTALVAFMAVLFLARCESGSVTRGLKGPPKLAASSYIEVAPDLMAAVAEKDQRFQCICYGQYEGDIESIGSHFTARDIYLHEGSPAYIYRDPIRPVSPPLPKGAGLEPDHDRDNRPYSQPALDIAEVPEPAGIFLAMLGMLVLARLASRMPR